MANHISIRMAWYSEKSAMTPKSKIHYYENVSEENKMKYAEIDEGKIEAFKGTISLAFEPDASIVDRIIGDRGIVSLRVIKEI